MLRSLVAVLAISAMAGDPEILSEVKRRLAKHPELRSTRIDVTVRDGAVILSGAVDRPSHKFRAVQEAIVDGVREVRADDLFVKPPWQAGMGRADEKISADVRSAIDNDARMRDKQASISVRNGVVTLAGIFDDLSAKLAAEDNALRVAGVVAVKNEISVQPAAERSDEELKGEVLNVFRADPELRVNDFEIEVLDGVIDLGGRVASASIGSRAIREAARVAGAKGIQSTIEVVEPQSLLPDEEQLRRAVELAIYRDPLLSPAGHNRVRVSIRGGVVVLSGRVPSWTEYTAATRDAFEAGARAVLNKLKLAMGTPPGGTTHLFEQYPGEVYPLDWNEENRGVERAPAAEPPPEPSPTPSPSPVPTPAPAPSPSPG